MRTVLVVDDDADIRASLSEFLCDEGAQVTVASSAEEALSMISVANGGPPALIISDVRMSGLSGLELLGIVRERAPSTDVVLMTAYDDMSTIVSAMRQGASEFITKPIDLADLRAVLARVFSDQKLRERNGATVDEVGAGADYLVGRDPRMIGIYKLVGQVAANRTTVGSPGTELEFAL